LVGRYMSGWGRAAPLGKVPELKEVLLPGAAWISYTIGAGAGATAAAWVRLPLLVPAVVLVLIVVDFVRDKGPSR